MKGSDVFVSASQSEGLSNALIESMYLGCVPVSTRSGGADEIIRNGENGILLNYGDESQMAAAIMQLYRNPDLRETLALQAEKTPESSSPWQKWNEVSSSSSPTP